MSCTVIPHPLSWVLSVRSNNPVFSLRPPSHCFCPSGKAKALCLQASHNTVSSSLSSSKPEHSTTKKTLTPVSNTTTPTTSLPPAPPPPTPLAPVVRPRRAQVVLKPVMFVLPPVHFPNPFSHQHNRTSFSRSFNCKWRTPVQTMSSSSGSLSGDAMVRSRPLFWAHKHQHSYKTCVNFCAKCLHK